MAIEVLNIPLPSMPFIEQSPEHGKDIVIPGEHALSVIDHSTEDRIMIGAETDGNAIVCRVPYLAIFDNYRLRTAKGDELRQLASPYIAADLIPGTSHRETFTGLRGVPKILLALNNHSSLTLEDLRTPGAEIASDSPVAQVIKTSSHGKETNQALTEDDCIAVADFSRDDKAPNMIYIAHDTSSPYKVSVYDVPVLEVAAALSDRELHGTPRGGVDLETLERYKARELWPGASYSINYKDRFLSKSHLLVRHVGAIGTGSFN